MSDYLTVAQVASELGLSRSRAREVLKAAADELGTDPSSWCLSVKLADGRLVTTWPRSIVARARERNTKRGPRPR